MNTVLNSILPLSNFKNYTKFYATHFLSAYLLVCVCVVDCQEPIKDSVNELSENTTVYVLRGMFVQLMKRK